MRRSRITSLPSSVYTCLRYRYRFGSVRDTMKTKSVTITSAGFQPPVPLPDPSNRAVLIVVRSEDAATGETEGGHAEPRATCRLARAICGIWRRALILYCGMQTGVIPDKQGIP